MKTIDEYMTVYDTTSTRGVINAMLIDAFNDECDARAEAWQKGARHVREGEVTRLKHDLQAEQILRRGLEHEHKRMEKLAQESLAWKANFENSQRLLADRSKTVANMHKTIEEQKATIAEQAKVGEDRTAAYYRCQAQLDDAAGRANSMALKLLEYEQHLGVNSAENTATLLAEKQKAIDTLTKELARTQSMLRIDWEEVNRRSAEAAALLAEKQKHVDALTQRVVELERKLLAPADTVHGEPMPGRPVWVAPEPRWWLCAHSAFAGKLPVPSARAAWAIADAIPRGYRIAGEAHTTDQVKAWINEGKLP